MEKSFGCVIWVFSATLLKSETLVSHYLMKYNRWASSRVIVSHMSCKCEKVSTEWYQSKGEDLDFEDTYVTISSWDIVPCALWVKCMISTGHQCCRLYCWIYSKYVVARIFYNNNEYSMWRTFLWLSTLFSELCHSQQYCLKRMRLLS